MHVVLAGCGNMGFAMLSGWIGSGRLAAANVTVVEPNDALRDRAAQLGVEVAQSAAAVSIAPGLVVVAVKPQVIRAVLGEWARFGNGQTAFLSIAAGTRISVFEDILGRKTPIIRCMPNTPAAIGLGMMAHFSNSAVSSGLKDFAINLLAASGRVAELTNEDQMDAVTAVSGSGPAYVFHFIECLTEAAKQVGLPDDIAGLFAMQTVYGAASLAAKSTDSPSKLREQVASPNGTTAAALSVLMGEGRLQGLVSEAVEAARKRSVELG